MEPCEVSCNSSYGHLPIPILGELLDESTGRVVYEREGWETGELQLGYINQLNDKPRKRKKNPIGFAPPRRRRRKKKDWPDVGRL